MIPPCSLRHTHLCDRELEIRFRHFPLEGGAEVFHTLRNMDADILSVMLKIIEIHPCPSLEV